MLRYIYDPIFMYIHVNMYMLCDCKCVCMCIHKYFKCIKIMVIFDTKICTYDDRERSKFLLSSVL